MSRPPPLWAARAWVDGRWQDDVLLRAGTDGCWQELRTGHPLPADAERLPGPVLPGLVNAHSHAFQRAFAGLAERRLAAHDDFWSWRERMYGVAQRLDPPLLRAVAEQLYTELLAGGYTQVCEFHYLHHDADGRPYPDRLAMARALVEAAEATGIGLTLLPVLYERAGFDLPALQSHQRRFATTVADVLALRDGVRALGVNRVSAGTAIHSLRAASAASIAALARQVADDAAPLHLHVAEQTAEVDACVAATGQRPIAWLLQQQRLDPRWQLVHATHAEPAEIDGVAACGAGVVLCPSTEANLGDGLPDLPRWLAGGAALSVGSDSQVGRCWHEELRWLEYGQRLLRRQRNVAADPAAHDGATAARLFERCLHGGAAAAGFDRWGLRVGAPADLLVADADHPGLAGVPQALALDALVFATDAAPWAQVWVGGRRVKPASRDGAATGAGFPAAMHALLG